MTKRSPAFERTDDSGPLEWVFGDGPWPDELVLAMLSPVPDFEPDEELVEWLTWQVVVRVRSKPPVLVPPRLKDWFVTHYASTGKKPRKTQPQRGELDAIAVEALQILYDISQAQAIRKVADARGARFETVEQNVHRFTNKKK